MTPVDGERLLYLRFYFDTRAFVFFRTLRTGSRGLIGLVDFPSCKVRAGIETQSMLDVWATLLYSTPSSWVVRDKVDE